MSTGNIGKIKASRVNNVPNVESYIGEKGILFYNYANGVIRMSDGITPGGVPIPYTVATDSIVGGIKAGPGANISVDGSLTIDTAGLPLSIGNLDIYDTTISTINPNTNLNLVTNGESDINLVGNLHIHPTSQGPDAPDPLFSFTDANVFTANGNVVANGNLIINGTTYNNGPTINNGVFTQIGNLIIAGNTIQTGRSTSIVSTNDMNTGAFEITGNTMGRVQPPALSGVMLHVTGQDNGTTPGRAYFDGVGSYAILVGRRYNGTVTSPTQAVTGNEVLRIAGTGYPTGGWPVTGLAQIRFIADENQTQTNRGGHIDLLTVPVGSNVVTQVMSVSATSGVSIAGNLTANVNATVTGNITAGNIDVTGTVSGHYTHALRNAGVIADGGTVTLDFITDDIVKCIWGNGMTVNYANLIPGRSVRLIATKATGTGTDSLSLDGISANNTSTGSNSISGAADVTYIIEFYSTNTSVAGLYAKI